MPSSICLPQKLMGIIMPNIQIRMNSSENKSKTLKDQVKSKSIQGRTKVRRWRIKSNVLKTTLNKKRSAYAYHHSFGRRNDGNCGHSTTRHAFPLQHDFRISIREPRMTVYSSHFSRTFRSRPITHHKILNIWFVSKHTTIAAQNVSDVLVSGHVSLQ